MGRARRFIGTLESSVCEGRDKEKIYPLALCTYVLLLALQVLAIQVQAITLIDPRFMQRVLPRD